MKKYLILCITILICTGCYAQKRLLQGMMTIKGTTYKVKNLDYGKISVYNPSNKYYNGIGGSINSRALPMKRSDMHVDEEKAKQIVYTILKNKLDKLKDNNETMNISVVFEQDGTLVDIGVIRLNQNTLITIDEIDQISRRLKNEVHMIFTGRDYLDYKAFDYNFSRIEF